MHRIREFMKYYKQTHFNRSFWVSPKWRLFVVLAVIAVMLLVKEHLENKYLAEFSESPVAFLVLDKVLYWFAAGIVIGAAAMFLMFEGEFAIGIWKRAKHLEQQAVQQLMKEAGARQKTRKKRKKVR